MARIVMCVLAIVVSTHSAKAFSNAEFAALDGRQAIEWRGIVVDLNTLNDFYLTPNARSLWVDGTQLTALAGDLFDALSRAEEDGLESADYLPLALTQFTSLQNRSDAFGFELAMSQAFIAFARDLHAGRTTPSVTDPEIVIARKETDAGAWLSSVATRGVSETLRSLAPKHRQYYQLRQMLAGYRALADRGGWPLVREGAVLKPGMRDPRVVDIRRNLTSRGYSGLNAAEPDVYDDDLKSVIEHFQKRHGLDADGIAGPATFGAMNVTADERVRQIVVNMERWRWLPVDLGSRHVFVNQAAFEMFTIDGGRVVDRRDVIVGKPFHKTPMFSDQIRYAEFNPTWTVPTSIAVRSKLPLLKKDPSYAERNGFTIYSGWTGNDAVVNPYAVDWSSVSRSRFPYRLVQDPGPKNVLGQVKFMFPNKFSVYLHDTPSRQLFARTGRAFSSGCIRIVKPLEFAALLFSLDQSKSRAEIDRIIGSRKITRVNLQARVPVHLAYFSAWIDDDGIPYFHKDVYERDALVARLLFDRL
ncbi:MAG: L,D-transpeptidase family protein [Pseudomonadota bacterium]